MNNFQNSNQSTSNSYNSNIYNPNLQNPNLTNSNLQNPNLQNPNLQNPNLKNSNFDERVSYSSTFNQKKFKSDPLSNQKMNNLQSNNNNYNYSYDTLFEAFPVNTRISTRDTDDSNILLSGAKMIPNSNINSSEFVHTQYKNSANKNFNFSDFNKNLNNEINMQFISQNTHLEKQFSKEIDNSYINPEMSSADRFSLSDRIDRKAQNNQRMSQLTPLAMSRALPMGNNAPIDNKHAYPQNTRYI